MDPNNQNNQINPVGQTPVTPVAQAPVASNPVPMPASPAQAPVAPSEQPPQGKKKLNLKFQLKFTKKTLIIFGVVVLFLIVIIYFSMSNSSLNRSLANLRRTNMDLTTENQKLTEEKAELEKKLEENALEQYSEQLLEDVPMNYYVYSLKLDASISYGSEITPETMIDIYLKTEINGMLVNEAYAENIKVIMLKDTKGNNIYSTMASTRAEEIIFAVPKEIHDWIAKADDLTGVTLYPVVKKGNAGRDPEMVSEYLTDYVASKTAEIPED